MGIRIFLRVDASPAVGAGHLVRCLALAEGCLSRGVEACFVTRSEWVQARAGESGYDVARLSDGGLLEDELAETRRLVSRAGIQAAVLDVCNAHSYPDVAAYAAYVGSLKAMHLLVLSFEDLERHLPAADIAVIPYTGAENLNLPEPAGCRYLLGPAYFILPPSFAGRRRPPPCERAMTALLTMGGSDPKGITLKVLQALAPMAPGLHIEVVLGDLCGITDGQVREALNGYKGTYAVRRGVRDMAAAMCAADIGIISSGLTKYEAAAAGLPCLAISYNGDHARMMAPFAARGTLLHLGAAESVSASQIREAVAALAADPERRQAMTEAGRDLVDGKGISRIVSEIETGLARPSPNGRRP
jgi:spore coat polysaccharide biosynthesis predicted glycosyltransferase SpsG